MGVTKPELLRVARLARLAMTNEEVDRYSRELSAVVEAMQELNRVDTSSVEPYDLSPQPSSATRSDVAQPRFEAEAVLEDAPDRAGRSIRLKGGTFQP